MRVLERWARNYALYRKIAKQVETEEFVIAGEKGLSLSPDFNALVKIQQALATYEKELSFTPASRARERNGRNGGGQ